MTALEVVAWCLLAFTVAWFAYLIRRPTLSGLIGFWRRRSRVRPPQPHPDVVSFDRYRRIRDLELGNPHPRRRMR